MTHFIEQLKVFKENNNLTYRQLQELTGIGISTLSDYLHGRKKPRQENKKILKDLMLNYDTQKYNLERIQAEKEDMLITKRLQRIQVNIIRGVPATTSRNIAYIFDKSHDRVLKDIDNLIKGLSGVVKFDEPYQESVNNFDELYQESINNFEHRLKIEDYFLPSEYIHPQNKQAYREYDLTEKGVMLLAMGYTGTRALQLKVAYINEFDKMKAYIKEYNERQRVLPSNIVIDLLKAKTIEDKNKILIDLL